MGLSSNQARFLSLTARQVDLEHRIQQVCQRRLRLSSELENVATAYNNSISNRKMFAASQTNQGIQTLSIANLAAIGYKIIGLNTDKVQQRPAINPVGKTVINSQAEFMNMVSQLNAGNNLGDSYVLNCDIDLSSMPALSNSLITQNFAGTFDGNGHVINGLTINTGGVAVNNVGLFAINTGTIKNVDLENVNINAANSNAVGAICGNNAGTIDNVMATGDISAFKNIGGISGANATIIKNSTANVNITGANNSVGGFVGYNAGASAVISDCASTGNVQAFGTYDMGGFVGLSVNGSKIENSYATGNVQGMTANGSDGGFVGGLYNGGASITNSYSTGTVTSANGGGGFAGTVPAGGSITNSYTTSNVSAAGGGFAFGVAGTVNNTNFYQNNLTTTAGSAVTNMASATALWNSSIWDKSTTVPTLNNAGYTAYADSLEEGLRNGTYSLVRDADEFTQDPLSIAGKKYEEIDWRQTPEIYDELNKSDDVAAENKYDKTVDEINSQDKKLQLEQTTIEVEYKAVASEKEAVKKILDTNATSSFKYFS